VTARDVLGQLWDQWETGVVEASPGTLVRDIVGPTGDHRPDADGGL